MYSRYISIYPDAVSGKSDLADARRRRIRILTTYFIIFIWTYQATLVILNKLYFRSHLISFISLISCNFKLHSIQIERGKYLLMLMQQIFLESSVHLYNSKFLKSSKLLYKCITWKSNTSIWLLSEEEKGKDLIYLNLKIRNQNNIFGLNFRPVHPSSIELAASLSKSNPSHSGQWEWLQF